MYVRTTLSLAAIIALLVVGAATASRTDRAVIASAHGHLQWTIPLPNAFGVVVENRNLSFHARTHADGTATGRIHYHQVVEGTSFIFEIRVTCMRIYDGNRAKLGGLVVASNNPDLPANRYGWFQVFDNGPGGFLGWSRSPRDQSSLLGFGTAEANQAFCDSPALPRFGPWDVRGDARVSDGGNDE